MNVRFLGEEPDDLAGLLAGVATLVADGAITLRIARTYPLTDAASAHRDSQDGHLGGKLVLVVTPAAATSS